MEHTHTDRNTAVSESALLAGFCSALWVEQGINRGPGVEGSNPAGDGHLPQFTGLCGDAVVAKITNGTRDYHM